MKGADPRIRSGASDPAAQRTAARRAARFAAFAREAGSDIFPVTVRDLSIDGCRIAGGADLEQGTSIWLKLPGIGARRARIAWTRAGEAGCEFALPIAEEQLETILAAARPRGG